MFNWKDLQTVGVAGSGVMGHGIALVFASKGYSVNLYDPNETALFSARQAIERFTQQSVDKQKMTLDERMVLLKRIHYSPSLDHLRGELIIEAIPENLSIKESFYYEIEKRASDHTILATNTSSIPVTRISSFLRRPERFVGLHFFNPAPVMKLVEVIEGEQTDPTLGLALIELCRHIGKVPARVKDSPGFIVNRIARFYYLESLRLYEEGVADYPVIDQIMENAGFRMGPFKLMDLIGIETNHDVTQSIYNAFFQEARFRPSRIQQAKVDAGLWGRKRGRGFYRYDG